MSRSCFGKNVPNFYRQSDLDPEKWTTYVSLVVSYQEVDVPKQFSAELRRDVNALSLIHIFSRR